MPSPYFCLQSSIFESESVILMSAASPLLSALLPPACLLLSYPLFPSHSHYHLQWEELEEQAVPWLAGQGGGCCDRATAQKHRSSSSPEKTSWQHPLYLSLFLSSFSPSPFFPPLSLCLSLPHALTHTYTRTHTRSVTLQQQASGHTEAGRWRAGLYFFSLSLALSLSL